MLRILTVILLALFLLGCSSEQKTIPVIDLQKVLRNTQEVPLSQFIESLEYIPLELTPESAIGQSIKLQLTEDYIIVRNYSSGTTSLFLLFDRKTGKFIRQLGKLGRGPEEYMRPFDNFYNPHNKRIYATGETRSSIRVYNVDGKFQESFGTPKLTETSAKSGYIFPSPGTFLSADTLIGYAENPTGLISRRLVIFTKNREIKSFPNYDKWSSEGSGEQFYSISQDPIFFSWGNKVSFKERSNDTIFSVSMEKLIPRYVLYSGDARFPYKLSREEALEQMTNPWDYFETHNLFENSNYLFFYLGSELTQDENDPTISHITYNICIFNKKTNNTIACKNDEDGNSYLTDDMNNFMQITPILITENNEMVAYLQASDIIKWLNENSAKSASLITKLPWLNDLTALDNPVIVIGKMKKK